MELTLYLTRDANADEKVENGFMFLQWFFVSSLISSVFCSDESALCFAGICENLV